MLLIAGMNSSFASTLVVSLSVGVSLQGRCYILCEFSFSTYTCLFLHFIKVPNKFLLQLMQKMQEKVTPELEWAEEKSEVMHSILMKAKSLKTKGISLFKLCTRPELLGGEKALSKRAK